MKLTADDKQQKGRKKENKKVVNNCDRNTADAIRCKQLRLNEYIQLVMWFCHITNLVLLAVPQVPLDLDFL